MFPSPYMGPYLSSILASLSGSMVTINLRSRTKNSSRLTYDILHLPYSCDTKLIPFLSRDYIFIEVRVITSEPIIFLPQDLCSKDTSREHLIFGVKNLRESYFYKIFFQS